MPKEYIGDGVYVDYDGYALTLPTEYNYHTGPRATNTIILEPNEWLKLVEYMKRSINSEDEDNIER